MATFFLFFFLRLKFDEESIGDGLSVVVFSGAVATALMILHMKSSVLEATSKCLEN